MRPFLVHSAVISSPLFGFLNSGVWSSQILALAPSSATRAFTSADDDVTPPLQRNSTPPRLARWALSETGGIVPAARISLMSARREGLDMGPLEYRARHRQSTSH